MHLLTRIRDAAIGALATGRARIRLRGPDARSFLHRLSTNAVGDLAPGQGRLNCFATDKGRFVDVVHHVQVAPDDVLLIGGERTAPALLAWLDRYLFTEKVELSDETAQGASWLVAGGGAPAVVDARVPGAGALPPWGFAASGPRLVVRTFPRVDASGAVVPAFLVVDDAQGIEGVEPASPELLEVARVAAGVPVVGREITDKHNPLDLELHDAVSWSKGCYIGQEVIARLDTYQKQARRLMGLVVDPAGVAPGDAILVDGAAVGEVTSVAPARWGDRPSALGMVRSKEKRDEIAVQVKRADGSVVDARAVKRAAAQEPHD